MTWSFQFLFAKLAKCLEIYSGVQLDALTLKRFDDSESFSEWLNVQYRIETTFVLTHAYVIEIIDHASLIDEWITVWYRFNFWAMSTVCMQRILVTLVRNTTGMNNKPTCFYLGNDARFWTSKIYSLVKYKILNVTLRLGIA